MIKAFKKAYFSQQFKPGIIGLLFNPFYISRKELYRKIEHLSEDLKGNILDVGCGSKPYEEIFKFKSGYTGLEYIKENETKNLKADYFYRGDEFPFENDSFDGIVFFQVLEHVFNPEFFLSEVKRCLKSNGRIAITIPFFWPEHEQPHDFCRYTSFGLSDLLKRSGFKITKTYKTSNNINCLLQLLIEYIRKSVSFKNFYLNLIFSFFYCFPLNFISLVFNFISPIDNDMFLDLVILAELENASL